ncbi:MAG: NAD(+)/NADH kinase [Bdellovibrionota bacterium]
MLKTLVLVSKEDDALALRARDALARIGSRSFAITQGLPNAVSMSDLIVCIGGDGTLLATIRKLGSARFDAMILGIHGSRGLGFLHSLTMPTESVDADIWAEKIIAMLESKSYVGESRWGLVAHAEGKNFWALNDVVVGKGSISRMIELEARSGDELILPRLRGDGLIVSSPTGSTAYSLSAGGPVLDPSLRALLLTPVCSHTMGLRPIVMAGERELTIHRLDENTVCQITMDGQEGMEIARGEKVVVGMSDKPVRLLIPMAANCRAPSYYEVLRTKLGFGRDRGC